MLGILDRVKKVSASDANILISGDTDSGKECIALMIHQLSPRSEEVFLARNCTAIPTDYFETEMFGHCRTSRSADGYCGGAFVEADKGTLFLDEIGDLGYSLQTELLLAIKEKRVPQPGSLMCANVNPRIICATSKDLIQCMRLNKFRDDLYYSVATVVLTILPLRERREDIIPLARHFAGRASRWLRTLTLEAENQLLDYDWPGNIRELRTMMDQAVILAATQTIQANELKFEKAAGRMDDGSRLLVDVERRHILNVIKTCNGNKTDAAKTLGLARSTLVLKLRSISALNSLVS